MKVLLDMVDDEKDESPRVVVRWSSDINATPSGSPHRQNFRCQGPMLQVLHE